MQGRQTPDISGAVSALTKIQSAVVEQAVRQVKESARRGGSADPGYLGFLAGSALAPDRLAQLFGTDATAGIEMFKDLCEIERTQVERQANDAMGGGSIGEARAAYLHDRLLAAGRLNALFEGDDDDSDSAELAAKLAELGQPGSLETEAEDVVARGERGERFDDDYVTNYLRKRLSDKARSDKDDGQIQAGKQLQRRLLDMQRSWLNADVRTARAEAAAGRPVPEFYIYSLTQRVVDLQFGEPKAKELKLALDDLIR